MKRISQRLGRITDFIYMADITINTLPTFEIFHHTTLRNHHQKITVSFHKFKDTIFRLFGFVNLAILLNKPLSFFDFSWH